MARERSYSIVMLFAGLLYPFWGFISNHFSTEVQDPIAIRLALAAVCGVVGVGLFYVKSKSLRRRLFLATVLIFAAHHLWLLQVNNYDFAVIASAYLGVTLVTAPITDLRHLITFYFIALAGLNLIPATGAGVYNRWILEGLVLTNAMLNMFSAWMRRSSELTLLKSEKQFRDMTLNVPGVVFQWQQKITRGEGALEEGQFVYLSPKFEEISGLSADDGHRLVDLIFPEDRRRFEASLREAVMSAGDWRYQGRILDGRGHTRWWSLHATPTKEAEDIFLFTGVFVDVTDRILGEQKMLETEGQLQLERARIIAASRLSSMGEMASGLAHEINNPLAVIMGSSQQIARDASAGKNDPEKLLKLAERISKTSDRIAKIVRGLRTFAKEGDAENIRSVPVHSIIVDALDFCQARFAHHGVDMRYAVAAETQTLLECRPAQISQVLLNLLNNSFDAIESQSSEKWIRVSVHMRPDHLQIWVEDSGTKMPKEVQDKLMQPFFTTKPVGKGTGLGLSISKGIIESHGGLLEYDRAAAHTTFKIELPLKQAAALAKTA